MEINNSEIISVKELNEALTFLEKNKNIKYLEIDFLNSIHKIDIVFIAGLILYHLENKTRFNIKSLKAIEDNKIIEVIQYLKQFGKMFNLNWYDFLELPKEFTIFFNVNITINNNRLKDIGDAYYKASREFAPILLINKENIDQIFNNKGEKLSPTFKEIKEKYFNLKIDDNPSGEYYLKSDNSILKEIFKEAPIYIIVFILLYHKVLPFKGLKKNQDKTIAVLRTIELWDFTKEYVSGLYELAKNIVQHSTKKEGIITIRTYNSEIDTNQFTIPKTIDKVLITHVFDYGDKGIIETLKEFTYQNISNQIFKDDYEILNNSKNAFTLKDFINPSQSKKLNQQIYRYLAHYGLMKFYELIEYNQGLVVCSSFSNNGSQDSYHSNYQLKNTLSIGCSYYFNLPFIQGKYEKKTVNFQPIENQGTIATIESISHFHKKKGAIINNKNLFHFNDKIENRNDENLIIDKIDQFLNEKEEPFIFINMAEADLSSSTLLRFCDYLTVKHNSRFIIYNVNTELYSKLVFENSLYLQKFSNLTATPFWHKDKGILFYTYIEIYVDSSTRRFNFVDLLFGQDEEQFHSINSIIQSSFPNSISIIENDNLKIKNNFSIPDSIKNYFFQASLLPFDISLVKSGMSLFLENLKTIIHLPLKKNVEETDSNPLLRYINKLDGYKINNTHFKLGSKIHVSDFIYAKRLFQNSFYSARLAMIIAQRINNYEQIKLSSNITLIGYEIYSELLLSLIHKYLKDFGFNEVNHLVVLDKPGGIEQLSDKIRIHENIFIIVPITSTGSTTKKIEEKLKKDNVINKVKNFDVVWVKDSSDEFRSFYDNSNDWHILEIETTWQNPKKCKWCFGNEEEKKENLLETRPLFETDKSSLTPSLVFDWPKCKNKSDYLNQKGEISNETNQLEKENTINFEEDLTISFDDVIFDNSLVYRQMKRNQEHFLYAHDTNSLIQDNSNPNKVKTWLQNLKTRLNISSTDKVILLSPSHHTNTGFINLVNDEVFHSSATIIHYQTGVDYLSNFKLLFEKLLSQKSYKIYFIDDTLITGSTFFKIYDLFRYTTSYKKEIILHGAIFLSNKAAPDISKRVLRAAKNIFAFVNINLPVPPKVLGKRPLEYEIEKYKALSNIAIHDVAKSHFTSKHEIIEFPEKHKAEDEVDNPKKERYLRMFKATHKAYEYFGSLNNDEEVDIEIIKKLIENNFEISTESKIENEIAIFKVLSQYPFYLFKPVKELVFDWHKKWFNETIQELDKNVNNKNKITYENFKLFKFLLRRAVVVDNNVIVCEPFIIKLFDFNSYFGNQLNYQGSLNNNQKKKVKELSNFILYQYIELFYKNPWAAVKLNKFIHNQSNEENCQRLFRMLLIESSLVLEEFYEMIHVKPTWRKLYNDSGKEIDDDVSKIKLYLNQNQTLSTNKYIAIKEILGINESDDNYNAFLNFLWLKQLLRNDIDLKEELKVKTNFILSKIIGLFKNDSIQGSFLVVTDNKNKKHLVYNEDKNGDRLFEDSILEETLISEFLDGKKTNNGYGDKSIIEYFLKDKKIIDSYDSKVFTTKQKSVHEQKNQTENLILQLDIENKDTLPFTFNIFPNDYNHLLLIRLSEHKKLKSIQDNEEKEFRTLGVIGLFSKKNEDLNNLNSDLLGKRLLMLLRKDLGNFIIRHHKSDEFSALREAEAVKRFAYLAGHGRNVMQALADGVDRDIFKNVIKTADNLQYFFATNSIFERNENFSKEFANKSTTLNFDRIKVMAEKIFSCDIVENSIPIQIDLIKYDNTSNKEKLINNSLFEFICFELLINAKKNRFHFLPSNYNISCTNYLKIEFEVNDNSLNIRITCSGPKLNDKTVMNINTDKRAIKSDNEVSGLKLIKDLLSQLNGKNKLSISESNIHCDKCKAKLNTVEITINKN